MDATVQSPKNLDRYATELADRHSLRELDTMDLMAAVDSGMRGKRFKSGSVNPFAAYIELPLSGFSFIAASTGSKVRESQARHNAWSGL